MLYQKYMRDRGVKSAYRKLLELKNTQRGFTIPFFDADGKVLFRQTRYVPPIVKEDGKELKATYPKGTKIDFCHLPLTRGRRWRADVYKKPSVPIWITESVSKGAAVAQFGYAVVTANSVYGHRSKQDARRLVRGMDTIPWVGRPVRILFDNDIYDNSDVQDALFDLGAELAKRGALVEVVLMPHPEWDEDERHIIKMGIDDFVAQQGDHAKSAIRALRRVPLDSPELATWGKHKGPPIPNVVDSLTFAPWPLEVLTNAPPPREYVMAHWIGARQLVFLAMAGGAGKGFLTLSMAVHIALGHHWFGMPVTQGRVALIGLEDSVQEMQRRLHFVVKQHADAIPRSRAQKHELYARVLENVRCESLEGLPLHVIEEQSHNIVQTPQLGQLALKLKALGPTLVIVDPLSQLHTLNENDNSVGSALVSAMGYIRTVADTAVLVPAHVSKDADKRGSRDANAMRGASSLATGARSVIHGDVLDKKQAVDMFEVAEAEAIERFAIFTHVKSNYGPKQRDIYMVRNESGVWIPHDVDAIPFRNKAADASQWMTQLQRWLTAQGRDYFTQTEVTQEAVADIFAGMGRPVAEKYFEDAVDRAVIRQLTKEERMQLPGTYRKGRPVIHCMAAGRTK